MAARSNAISELTRFWLQTRHGCFVDEAIPVKVPHAHSDIDLAALRSDLQSWSLPNGAPIIRAIIELMGDLWHLLVGYCDLRSTSTHS